MTVVDWPIALVRELADKRVVLVVGSGLSATAKNADGESPPTWSDLIRVLGELSAAHRLSEIEALLGDRRYVEAAEELVASADAQSFSHALRRVLVDPHFEPSQAHRDLMTIDQPIVVNLNYDRIYEKQCLGLDPDSYVVTHYYDTDFVRNIRSPQRVVLKLHGSTDDPSQVVFGLTSYAAAQRRFSQTFDLLGALLATRTVFFVGCGFNGDPDVDRLLTEAALRLEGAFPHYALVSDQGDTTAFAGARSAGLNLQMIEYPVPTLSDGSRDFSAFEAALADLRDQVLATRQSAV